ncbi:glucosamine-6-phosphate deaminase [Bacillus sp. SD088]|uniref:glucosamine-6-phosphate deaminase n=1 Tax=Bacillus sp. SD088 TaxID=2782012 RepID=UPI0037C0EB89
MNLLIHPIKKEKVGNLTVRVYESRKAMGKAAAVDVIAKMKELLQEKANIRMIFASAPSQNEFLETLRQAPDIDWSRITVFHMDEYIGLSAESPQRFSTFLTDQLFDHVKPGTIHLIDSSNDATKECKRYSQLLKEAPVDIVCLGIGENGHIAFNDPPVADFEDPQFIKAVELDEISRQQQVNDGCFPTIDDVPTHALTLTIPALMSGNYLYCIVPGKTKKVAVKETLNNPISSKNPATVLRRHPNCILYLDEDSYGSE